MPAVASRSIHAESLRDPSAWTVFLTLLVLLLSAVEGWYRRTDFATDAISYLDISRALPAHDWKMVFNPLWSAGYPALLALIRPVFAASPGGEWAAIHVLNLLVLLATWSAFLYLLRAFDPLFAALPQPEARMRRRLLHFAGVAIFLAIQLCIDSVARVGPDMLVTLFFFLATGTLLRLVRTPTPSRAVLLGLVLGLVLGAGYWSKGIFFPLSLVMLAVAAAALLRAHRTAIPVLLAAGVFALLAAPYVAGLTWSYGHFTTGESGNLNYAFHVNYLPRWTNWQGSAGYGTPIHPTHEVMRNPDLFVFGEPYHNTYPPFGNIAYWYEGYRHFFSLHHQLTGAMRDLAYLAHILLTGPIFYAVALATLLLFVYEPDRRALLIAILRLWPLYLAGVVGILLYVQVHLEDRYLGSFLNVLCLTPFAAAALYARLPAARVRTLVCVVLGVGAALNLAIVDRDVLDHLRHRYTYAQNPQWRLGLGLARLGLAPGDRVAVVGGPNAQCTWAYVARVRIVAELGGDPYDQLHPSGHPTDQEIHQFWSAAPEDQRRILGLFRQAGAVAVIAPVTAADHAPAKQAGGWHPVPGTNSWVYFLK
ncbi:hypothetical protein [Silvibacterium sp.]|uniref:hypothetical protein n=1 Tax=Silvibacterium sp. TaxID=1964179 RepID=UPI0039E2A961